MIKYFKWSFSVLILGAVFAFWRGESISSGNGISFLISFFIISVMEVSLSFDNAVVNAKKLATMNKIWQDRFLTWGIAIAVFGMRFIFPILIVSIFSGLGNLEVLNMALKNPDQYAHHLEKANVGISSFGGCFLFMLFFDFVLHENKVNFWIKRLEYFFAKIGKFKFLHIIFSFSILYFIQIFIPQEDRQASLISGISGIAIYFSIHSISNFLNKGNSIAMTGKAGLMGFIYLEFIDASFSLDGVLGAFALTKDVTIIAVALGVGAFFVRSLTIMLVHKETLTKLRYITNGAYWAIATLATVMMISTFYEVPEFITGLVGALFIFASLYSSIKANKRQTHNLR